jgi:RNA polymerase-binding transcription factor DksA
MNERRRHLEQAAEPLEPHSMSLADSATDEFDHELALSRLSTEQDALYEVEDALRRIADGTYGRCVETGKPIPPGRLRAIPWTRFSREAEAHLEELGAVSHSRLGRLGSVHGPAEVEMTEPGQPNEPDEGESE